MTRSPARKALISTALLLALGLGACDDQSMSDVEHLARAERFLAENDIEAALIEARNAAQANPDNPDARAMLGQLLIRSGDFEDGAHHLWRALELGAGDEVLTTLTRSLANQGRFADILELVPEPESLDDPGAIDQALIRANALRANGDREAARRLYQRVNDAAPSPEAFAGLAQLALDENDVQAAERLVMQGMALDENSPDLLVVQGELALREGDAAAARETFRRAQDNDTPRLDARLGNARALLVEGDYDEAARELEGILSSAPGSVYAAFLRAVAAFETDDYALAQRLSEAVLQATPDNVPALLIAGASAFGQERNEVALRHLTRALALDDDNPAVRRLLAATQMRLGQFDAAAETFGPQVEELGEDANLMTMAGLAALRSGDVAGGIRLLDEAVARDPEDPLARTRLGLLQLAGGETEVAIEQLEAALARNPDLPQAKILLTLALIRNGDYDRAISEARALQDRFPEQALGHVLEGIASAIAEDEPAAVAAFETALEIEPGQPDAANNLALLALRRGDVDAARQYFTGVLDITPDHVPTLLRLARLEGRAGNAADAEETLARAVSAAPDEIEPKVRLARSYLGRGNVTGALDLLEPLVYANTEAPAVYELTGLAYLADGDAAGALRMFQQLTDLLPDSPEAWFRVAQAREALGDRRELREALETAIDRDDTHLDSRLAYARLLLAGDEIEAAATQADQAAAIAPDNPAVALLQAQVLAARGDPEAADRALREAYDAVPSRELAVALARRHMAQGEPAAAAGVLEDWLAESPEDTGARAVLASVRLESGDMAEAESLYRTILAERPENVVALNNLAWILAERGALEEARGYAEQAVALAGDSPQVLDTLGTILLDMGETDEAGTILEQAWETIRRSPPISPRLWPRPATRIGPAPSWKRPWPAMPRSKAGPRRRRCSAGCADQRSRGGHRRPALGPRLRTVIGHEAGKGAQGFDDLGRKGFDGIRVDGRVGRPGRQPIQRRRAVIVTAREAERQAERALAETGPGQGDQTVTVEQGPGEVLGGADTGQPQRGAVSAEIRPGVEPALWHRAGNAGCPQARGDKAVHPRMQAPGNGDLRLDIGMAAIGLDRRGLHRRGDAGPGLAGDPAQRRVQARHRLRDQADAKPPAAQRQMLGQPAGDGGPLRREAGHAAIGRVEGQEAIDFVGDDQHVLGFADRGDGRLLAVGNDQAGGVVRRVENKLARIVADAAGLRDHPLQVGGIDMVTGIVQPRGHGDHLMAQHGRLRAIADPGGHRQQQIAVDGHLQGVEDQLAARTDDHVEGRRVDAAMRTVIVQHRVPQLRQPGDRQIGDAPGRLPQRPPEALRCRKRRLAEAHMQHRLAMGALGAHPLIRLQGRREDETGLQGAEGNHDERVPCLSGSGGGSPGRLWRGTAHRTCERLMIGVAAAAEKRHNARP
ncbi:MAG: PEP-CTERM system TPR-repeat protein PrsT [Alphaproteobacteria bacterium]|jgi:putative PEP-CTERM system TPR-repeat lipoprotein|nr:PEP-CTERM system TPR-repeat protein PrsT [Alphaproteobacteria bacterium]